MRDVAVIGGGLYGCLIALELAQTGSSVELFEKRSTLLSGASGVNQGRLHLGYHYPRSLPTALSCQAGSREFARRFPEALRTKDTHYYCVASDSKVGWEDYLDACQRASLLVRRGLPPVELRGVSDCLWVDEPFVDMERLRIRLQADLARAGVMMRLGTSAMPERLDHQLVIDATHGALGAARQLRYEVVELITVRLPQSWNRLSLVVMDGDYCSIDPVPGRPGCHHLYHVLYSVVYKDEGRALALPDYYRELVEDEGVSYRAASGRFGAVRVAAARIAPGLRSAEYVSSRFALRTVLAGADATDSRPTMIEQPSGRLVKIIGGKLADAPAAARRVRDMVGRTCAPGLRSSAS